MIDKIHLSQQNFQKLMLMPAKLHLYLLYETGINISYTIPWLLFKLQSACIQLNQSMNAGVYG